MPRLTNQLYIERHYFLRKGWTEGLQILLAVLPAHRQLAVHQFYQPDKDLTDEELINYRKQISMSQPSLPQRASRYLLQMQDAFEAAYAAFEQANFDPRILDSTLRQLMPVHSKDKIRVLGVVQPEPDLRQLARMLMDETQSLVEEREQRGRAA